MVTEEVSQKGGFNTSNATTEERNNNPLLITMPPTAAQRFPIHTWRCRNGRGPDFDKWEFNIHQLCEALGEPDILSMPVPLIATPSQLTRESQAHVQRQAAELARYQRIITALHYHVLPSLDLSGSSELHDQRILQKHVSRGKADGVATVAWALQFADVSGIDKQAELLDNFRKLQLSSAASCVDLHKHVNKLYEIWRLLAGTNLEEPLPFYRQLMVSMPTQPQASHIVNTRTHFALQIQQLTNGVLQPELQSAADFADVIVKHARTIGLPEGAHTKGGSLNYLRLDVMGDASNAWAEEETLNTLGGERGGGDRGNRGGGDRGYRQGSQHSPQPGAKSIADNNCTFCDSYICQSALHGGPSKCICRWDSKFKIDEEKTSRGNARHVRIARKWHGLNKTVRTLKGVRFRFTKEGEERKPTGGSPGQQVASIVMQQCFPGESGQAEFDEWLSSQDANGDVFMALGLDSTMEIEAYVDGDLELEFGVAQDDGEGVQVVEDGANVDAGGIAESGTSLAPIIPVVAHAGTSVDASIDGESCAALTHTGLHPVIEDETKTELTTPAPRTRPFSPVPFPALPFDGTVVVDAARFPGSGHVVRDTPVHRGAAFADPELLAAQALAGLSPTVHVPSKAATVIDLTGDRGDRVSGAGSWSLARMLGALATGRDGGDERGDLEDAWDRKSSRGTSGGSRRDKTDDDPAAHMARAVLAQSARQRREERRMQRLGAVSWVLEHVFSTVRAAVQIGVKLTVAQCAVLVALVRIGAPVLLPRLAQLVDQLTRVARGGATPFAANLARRAVVRLLRIPLSLAPLIHRLLLRPLLQWSVVAAQRTITLAREAAVAHGADYGDGGRATLELEDGVALQSNAELDGPAPPPALASDAGTGTVLMMLGGGHSAGKRRAEPASADEMAAAAMVGMERQARARVQAAVDSLAGDVGAVLTDDMHIELRRSMGGATVRLETGTRKAQQAVIAKLAHPDVYSPDQKRWSLYVLSFPNDSVERSAASDAQYGQYTLRTERRHACNT